MTTSGGLATTIGIERHSNETGRQNWPHVAVTIVTRMNLGKSACCSFEAPRPCVAATPAKASALDCRAGPHPV
jgi:hypothetical protein